VHDWLGLETNQKLLERLAEAGVRMDEPASAEPDVEPILDGQQIVLTGSLETMTRDEAKAAIEARRGRVTSSVSKKTTFVVVGAGTTSAAIVTRSAQNPPGTFASRHK